MVLKDLLKTYIISMTCEHECLVPIGAFVLSSCSMLYTGRNPGDMLLFGNVFTPTPL